MTMATLPTDVTGIKADIIANSLPAITALLAMFPDGDDSNYNNLSYIWNQLDGLQDTLTEFLPG